MRPAPAAGSPPTTSPRSPTTRGRGPTTPTSALDRIEIWLSILVRKLLRRASFTSVDEPTAKVLPFIAYYNRTMAKPFKWTYHGKALTG
jgi:hypothetical protein